MTDITEPYFQNLFAERIGGKNYGKSNEIYKFEKIKRAKAQAKKDFPNVTLLDFGIGENDEMADEKIRQALKTEVDKLENRGYADNGVQIFKDAASVFMKKEYGIALNPETEIMHCIGTKPALAMIPAAFINPGDITIMTVPGYPVAGTHTRYYGGEVYRLQLKEENRFLPDLESIPQEIKKRAKLLVINYPNSPTGGLATLEFFQKIVDFAKTNEIIVVNDAAHINYSYSSKPISFLSTPGAMEVGVETHSMSKGFDMIGWRLGFVAGNAKIVRAYGDVKDNCDSGQFIGIQKAAAVALETTEILQKNREKYERRLKKLVTTLNEVGFSTKMPGGTYFLYTKAPKGVNGCSFETAEDASQFLIKERSICTVPWDDAGAYLRFSTTYYAPSEKEEDDLMIALKERLAQDKFIW
jgi:LL-diaminopimelate aminotransferase